MCEPRKIRIHLESTLLGQVGSTSSAKWMSLCSIQGVSVFIFILVSIEIPVCKECIPSSNVLVWVYTVNLRPVYGTLSSNGLRIAVPLFKELRIHIEPNFGERVDDLALYSRKTKAILVYTDKDSF